jgi:hypothetical protein
LPHEIPGLGRERLKIHRKPCQYTKVSEYRIGQITSPLDLLGTEEEKVLG